MALKRPELTPEEQDLADYGLKIAHEYNMHRVADPIGNLGKFLAFGIQDAETDHTLYDSMADARAHQSDEDRCFYVQLVPATMDPRDAALMMRAHRKMYSAGIRQSQMGGRTMIPRSSREDNTAQLRSIFRGTRPTNLRW